MPEQMTGPVGARQNAGRTGFLARASTGRADHKPVFRDFAALLFALLASGQDAGAMRGSSPGRRTPT